MSSRWPAGIITKNPVTPAGPVGYGAAPGIWRLDEAAYWQKQGLWPDANLVGDQYIKYVSLLLSSTSLSNANNNLFVDSGGAFNPVSRFGNTTQGSFSPYGSNWSNYFDGSGDYFTVPYTTANFDWWTSGVDFTIEAWVFATSLSTWQYTDSAAGVNSVMVGNAAATSEVNYWSFGPLANGTVRFKYYNGANNFVTSTATITANTWNHVAMTKTSSGITVYVNGVAGTTTAISGTPQSSTSYPLIVGQINNATASGYISNLRIVRGTAIYSGNFTVPTAPLTAVTNTTLLTCQSNRYRDASTNNLTLTVTGDTKVQKFSPFSPAYPGAVYNQSDITNWSGFFDGTGDYLSVANSSANNLGTSDFTIELWFKSNTGTLNTHACFVASYSSAVSGSWAFKAQSGTSGYIEFASYGPSWNDWVTTTNIAADRQWHHCAVTRSGNTLRIFVDGAVAGTWDISGASSFTGGGHPLTTGFMAQDSTSYLNGNLSNVRIVKGTALYTAAFTPPTSPLTAISGTAYLTCQNAAFTDNSTNNLVISQNGNPTVTGNSPFNTTGYWSNIFPGSGNYLTVANSTPLNLSGGSYTIEMWINPQGDYGNYNTLVAKRVANSSSTAWEVYLRNTTGVLSFYNGANYESSTTPTPGVWSHVAAVYDGTNINVYLNGTRLFQYAVSNNDVNANIQIGSYSSYDERFVGSISNLRITKGAALYSGASFTPPTGPLTTAVSSGTVSLLTCQSSRVIDNSANAATVTVTGSVNPQPFNPFYSSTIASNGGSLYLDGSGDYLTSPTSANYDFRSGNFTIEGWFYFTNSTANAVQTMFSNYTSFASAGSIFYGKHTNNSGYVTVWFSNYSTGGPLLAETTYPPNNAWTHYALVRNGNTFTLYRNGVSTASASWSGAATSGANAIWVGAAGDAVTSYNFPGYINGFRITKSAVYTAAFTPPTAPLTPSANTILLLNGMNAGAYDATAINDMETVGNAQVSTVQSKFGGSSVYFPNTTDYVSIPDSPNLNFGSGNFTLEAWVYITGYGNGQTVVSKGTNFSSGSSWTMRINQTTGYLSWVRPGVAGYASTLQVPTNQWTHIAISRIGTNFYLAVGGTVQTVSGTYQDETGPMILGWTTSTSSAGMAPPYIDDVRITKGVARYTTNFTPPTQAFPVY